jgi:predicted NBD/HSP70 family sugar kinase
MEELLGFVLADLPARCRGIAYAVGGEIENHDRVVKSPYLHFLDGIQLGEQTREVSNKPVVVGNDMEAAALGMAALCPDLSYFMAITWSSGIGLRIIKDRTILAQSEGGHMVLDHSPFALRCGCGVRGCAESILGGQALRRRVTAETAALGIRIPDGLDPCRFLDDRFDKGDEWARAIYDLISSGMATFLANMQTVFRLPAIVWKGTFAKHALPRVENDIRTKMEQRLINPLWARQVEFRFSPKPDVDGLIGAAELFRWHMCTSVTNY